MGLTAAIRSSVEAAFDALGDIVTTNATYHSAGTFGWSPATGQTETGGADYTVSKMLFVKFSSQEIDGEKVLPNDEKALIPYKHLTVTPKETDTITKSGVIRNVQGVSYDPAQALWILHVRRTGL